MSHGLPLHNKSFTPLGQAQRRQIRPEAGFSQSELWYRFRPPLINNARQRDLAAGSGHIDREYSPIFLDSVAVGHARHVVGDGSSRAIVGTLLELGRQQLGVTEKSEE